MELKNVKILKPAEGVNRLVIRLCVPKKGNEEFVQELMASNKKRVNISVSNISAE